MYEKFGSLVVKLRWLILIVYFGLFLPSSDIYFNRMVYDNSIDIWFSEETKTMKQYREFREMFESDYWIVVGYYDEEIFTTENLQLISRLTKKIGKVKYIGKAVGITNAQKMTADSGGSLKIKKFIERIPDAPEKLAALKVEALASDLYRDNYISHDGKTAVIFARVDTTDLQLQTEAIFAVEEITRQELAKTGGRIYFADTAESEEGKIAYDIISGKHTGEGVAFILGMPVSTYEFDRLSRRDNAIFTPLVTVILIVILLATFRKFVLAFIPYLTIFFATIFTMAIFFLTGHTMNTTTSLLPPIILALSVAVSIHIVVQYLEERNSGYRKSDAIIKTFGRIGLPCLFTSITTAIGFGSFLSSEIIPLRTVGIFTSVGIMLAYIITFTFNGALLSVMKPYDAEKVKKTNSGVMTAFLAMTVNLNRLHWRKILVVALLLATASGVGIGLLNIETNSYEYMKKSNWLRKANDFLQEEVSGVMQSEIIFEGEPGFCFEPKFLQKVEQLQNYSLQKQQYSSALSFIVYLKEIHSTMSAPVAGEPAGETVACYAPAPNNYCIPNDRNLIAQYMLLAETGGDEDISAFTNLDRSTFRLTLRSNWVGSKVASEISQDLKQWIETNLPGYDWHFSGATSIYVELEQMILRSQLRSFGIALILVMFMMIALVRDLKTGLLSMIPNVLPIAVTLGFMGYAGIKLDTATVMIASVAIGIAVDDTIHYLHRFRRELEKDGDYNAAMERTSLGIGRAIVFTSIVLFFGFSVLIFASFVPTIYFGMLTAVTMVSAVIGDLLLLPVLLIWLKPFGTKFGEIKEQDALEGEAGC
jgi:uncharacterized protein